jgi:hypothetical protein
MSGRVSTALVASARGGLAWLIAASGGCGPIDLGSFGPMSPDAMADHAMARDAMSPVSDAGMEPRKGDASDAGHAGDAAMPECQTVSQCDDDDPCNGVHACVTGHCQQVSPACTSPDEAHCDAVCDPSGAQLSCLLLAHDGDGDKHGDVACVEASEQADDCDDGEPSVHPGAPELCDGLDNDCNGRGDLEDGVALGGENVKVGLGLLPVVASSSENTFGGAYATSDGKVTFYSFHNDGSPLLGALQIVHMDVMSDQVVPAIAWGKDTYGLVWSRNNQVRFLELALDGVPKNPAAANNQELARVSPASVSTGFSNVAPVGDDSWLVFYQSHGPGQLWARRIASGGELLEPVVIASGGFEQPLSVASTSDGVAAAWIRREGSTDYVEWVHGLDGFSPTSHTPMQLDMSTGLTTVSSVVIAAGPRGYGIVWSETASFGGGVALRFAEYDTQGNALCEPFDVERPLAPAPPALVPTALVATEDGYVVAGYTLHDDGISADLIEVTTTRGCRLNQRARVADQGSRHVSLARARTGQFLLLWDAPNVNDYPEVYRRVLPPRLCSEPATP